MLATPEGARLAAEAREILRAVDLLVAGARGSGEPLCGELWLGVIPTIAPYLLPPALAALRAAYPRLELCLREDSTANLCAGLERGDLDVLLLAREAELGKVAMRDLFADPFLVAVPGNHALAGRAHIAIDDLASERLILLEDGH